jgi:hypothetical protein
VDHPRGSHVVGEGSPDRLLELLEVFAADAGAERQLQDRQMLAQPRLDPTP